MKPQDLTTRVPPSTALPQALLTFMTEHWRVKKRQRVACVPGLSYFLARRNRLSAAFANEVLVIPTGGAKIRANDTHYRFRPGSDFYYLTGNLESDCVLVLLPKEPAGHTVQLFVEPNLGRQDPTFFTDRDQGEFWVGPRLGVDESKTRYGVDACLPLAYLPAFLAAWLANKSCTYRLLEGVDTRVQSLLPNHTTTQQAANAALAVYLSEQRLIKDALEIKALKEACASTRRGFEDVIVALREAKSEREVEGLFNLRARVEGNDVGYNTIAAAGAHACILHWSHNHGALRRGDLLLLDAGVESNTLYTADVTRTLPISGTFSPAQKTVYNLVLAAQTAALQQVRPGADFMAPNQAAMQVLTQGLVDLGILKVSVAEALHPDQQLYKRYTLHQVSHMLGLDVHDCAAARAQTYRYGQLQPGMVLTVEPGLYFQPDDLTVPPAYRGIGVRIEDDVWVTKRGHVILSDVPREAHEVEKWMRSIWRRAKPR